MLFSELYKIMANKVTFIGFRDSDRSNRPLPLGSAPVLVAIDEHSRFAISICFFL